MAYEVEHPVTENGPENYPCPPAVTAQQAVCKREESCPDSVHQEAVTERDIVEIERVGCRDPGTDPKVLQTSDGEDHPEKVRRFRGCHQRAEGCLGRYRLCKRAYGEVSNEHAFILDPEADAHLDRNSFAPHSVLCEFLK